jgi:hypothetical protein
MVAIGKENNRKRGDLGQEDGVHAAIIAQVTMLCDYLTDKEYDAADGVVFCLAKIMEIDPSLLKSLMCLHMSGTVDVIDFLKKNLKEGGPCDS